VFSGYHEESIRMLLSGAAQVSAVDSLVLDYERKHNPQLASKLRVVKSLGPVAIPPVVVSTALSKKKYLAMQNVLLEMSKDPKGRSILSRAYVSHFEKVEDEIYNGIRKMRDLAKEVGFERIR